ncbi:circularly permuted type 2 ATP-grasp protein [Aurantimonas sp. HBX-1]|uniref:circularly permuted type 2 ATP-grasp protein n=1 Tax=Aurantimonas sp. HBX-1 TaxID=2906072 RepID=UPI001F22B5BD|nr:circularly permuted type 2 ATP-grasp protein [Aurantimonas sp. HBX-1]UIJ72327.1 circularly permuted type 2 ATP-grasp protein [Aurantimonas sp. HBX-1]
MSRSPFPRYASLVGTGRDEMLAADGSVRPHYRPLVDALGAMPAPEREARFRSASQYLSEAGVHHRIYRPGDADEEEREWPLSQPPLVVDPAEWAGLASGLVQRAEFLERLLGDIYGERKLVREGVLPGPILGSNPEFLRPLADQGRAGEPLIRFIAVDLGRGPDGRWWVLGDRTQAPSGAGFALENRVATSKAFPDLARQMNVERMAAFFHRFREMLNGLAGGDMSGIGLLTPGPHNETYFEHAYLARYLGLLLLEGGDLVVHRDRADVRTVDGFQPIRVLWRRLDAEFCDPLELFGGSRIGTPGLLRAIRSGALAVINAPGSGILESRALMAFQKPLARALIGEELALPTIATWWCGQESERRFVAANRERLQLASAFPPAAGTQPGPTADALYRPDMPASEGIGLVAEEIAALSTAPVFIDGELEPRPVTWRVFLSRDEAGWHVMPGGFARIADSRDARAVSMQAGGRSADVWIPSGEAPRPITLLPRDSRFLRRVPGALPARAADNLFWLGRYAERCEVATRLVRLHAGRQGELLPTGEIDARVEALLAGLGVAPAAMAKGLLALARRAADTASRIRDRFSPDGWRTLDELVALIQDAQADEGHDTVALANQILTRLSGFTGLVRENMYQFAGWRFMQCGRRIERGRMSAHVASVLLAGDAPEGALEGLLEFTDSRVTYRRRYSVELSRETVVDLTVLDPLNPRSVAFQVNSLADRLAELPGMHAAESPDLLSRRIARLKVRLQTADASEIDTAFLDRAEGDLGLISDLLTERYLLSSPGARPDRAAPE